MEPDHGLRGFACPNITLDSKEVCSKGRCKRKYHRLLHFEPMERQRMRSCPVSSRGQECQKKESGQQEVPAILQVIPFDQDLSAVLLEVQREQLTELAGQREMSDEGLAVLAAGQDATAILQEVLAGEQNMQPVLLEVPPGSRTGYQSCMRLIVQSRTGHQSCRKCCSSCRRRCRGRRIRS
jgi:hypothetical protein